MEKRIGLTSICFAYTCEVVEFLVADPTLNTLGINGYFTFKSFVEKFLGGEKINGRSIKKNILLPAINQLNKTKINGQIVLFDMETLMHDEAVKEIKETFQLCCLDINFKNVSHIASPVEKALYEEYAKRLSNIGDCVIECNNSGDYNLILNKLGKIFTGRH